MRANDSQAYGIDERIDALLIFLESRLMIPLVHAVDFNNNKSITLLTD
jgi:hypothetical protein